MRINTTRSGQRAMRWGVTAAAAAAVVAVASALAAAPCRLQAAGDAAVTLVGAAAAASSPLQAAVRLTTAGGGGRGGVACAGAVNTTAARSLQVVASVAAAGVGTTLGGEGVAVWLTAEALQGTGPVLGGPATYTGVGVFIDTYHAAGTDARPVIAVVANDGTLTVGDDAYTSSLHAPTACTAPGIRDTAGDGTLLTLRLSWAAADRRLQVAYVVGTSVADTAARAPWEWKLCGVLEGVTLPPATHIAVTAATGGDFGDSHTLLALAADTDTDADADDDGGGGGGGVDGATAPPSAGAPRAAGADAHANAHTEVAALRAAVEARAAGVEAHLAALAARLAANDGALERRLAAIERSLAARVQELATENERAAGAWTAPFAAVCGVLVGLAAWGAWQTRTIMKLHAA